LEIRFSGGKVEFAEEEVGGMVEQVQEEGI